MDWQTFTVAAITMYVLWAVGFGLLIWFGM